ncbi:AMP-binding protein, partial [Frigidibacter sp. MR17.14]|uniref:class I adenylate-forming enzyme family protein n=1 Tax=Frigidibacter sp. MR17.14 TaxID=3126509 RepID=UPI003012A986
GLAKTLGRVHGIAPGDRVALFAPNSTDYLVALYGVLWLGAVVVPINAKLHPREAAWILEDAGARLVLTGGGRTFAAPDLMAALPQGCAEAAIALAAPRAAPPQPPAARGADDLAWLFYTSGTTGRPKGVMLSHRNLMMMSYCYAIDVDAPGPQDNVLYAAPISHGAGLYGFPALRGGSCHVVPDSKGFAPDEIERLAQGLGGLVFFAAPTMIKRMVDAAAVSGFDGQGIKTVIYGGGPMYLADLERALAVFGPRFVQIYGQGETPMTITVLTRALVADQGHPGWRARRASVGQAQACVELRVVGPDMETLPAGETGEIVLRSPTVMQGYWRNPKATAEAIRDGWLCTGDLGRVDEDGFLTLTDRSKDVIISGGTNIYPREVEEVLLTHPGVSEVSVVGAPNAEWGEEVVAFVVPEAGAACDAGLLDGWCRAQIASFKKPRRYAFVAELPKNSYGKVLKTELRAQLDLLPAGD